MGSVLHSRSWLMMGAMLCGGVSYAGDVPYAVPTKPCDIALGHHRAVIRADQKADALLAELPWRCRDHDAQIAVSWSSLSAALCSIPSDFVL